MMKLLSPKVVYLSDNSNDSLSLEFLQSFFHDYKKLFIDFSKDLLYSSYDHTLELISKKTFFDQDRSSFIFLEYSSDFRFRKLLEIFENGGLLVFVLIKNTNKDLSIIDKNIIKDTTILSPSVAGIIDMSSSLEFYFPVLKLFFIHKSGSDERLLMALEKNLEVVLAQTVDDLKKARAIYQKILPVNKISTRGSDLYYRYQAGISGRSEFVEIFQGEKQHLIVTYSTNSHLLSVSLMQELTKFYKKKSFDLNDIKEFMNDFAQIAAKISSSVDNAQVYVLMLILNFNTMKLEGYGCGPFRFASNHEESIRKWVLPQESIQYLDVNKAYVEYDLSRNERIVILSPGMANELERSIDRGQLRLLIKDLFKQDVEEMINELFYQGKKNGKNGVPNDELTAFIIEVKRNAILQV